MKIVAEFPANQHYVRESKWPWWTRPATGEQHQFTLRKGKGIELKDGITYTVTVAAVLNDDRGIAMPVQVTPEPNWMNWNQINNLLLALLFGGIVFYAISTAKKREIFLRRIPGLDAVDEAIGRATELGKPILYLTGAHDMSDPSTIAAAVILGRVAKRTAAYETDLLVPHRDPITMAVCQEITKQAYMEAGKPDLYKEDSAVKQEQWDVAPLPSKDGAKPGPGCLGDWNLGVSKFSTKQKQALEAVRILTSFEFQRLRFLDGGFLPSRPAVFDDPDIQKKYAYAKAAQASFENLKPRPVTPFYPDMSANAIQPAFGQAMAKQLTPDQAIKQMADKMRQIIKTG